MAINANNILCQRLKTKGLIIEELVSHIMFRDTSGMKLWWWDDGTRKQHSRNGIKREDDRKLARITCDVHSLCGGGIGYHQ